jgi:hypothetical protein
MYRPSGLPDGGMLKLPANQTVFHGVPTLDVNSDGGLESKQPISIVAGLTKRKLNFGWLC